MAKEPGPTSDANGKPAIGPRAEFAEALRPRGKIRYAAEMGEKAGDFLGPYKLLDVLGEGGFGRVWLAERREPHVQRVALKVIKPGMDSASVIARFEQERQALAVMDHPNVAKVYDAGTSESGRPYFVMEYVQGEPITDYCDRHTLTTKQRLEIFVPVCEAVQHAHMKGIIHRDIKPTNVMITVKDGTPVPKVIDFGVAKAVSRTLTDKTLFTLQGQLIGTPEYMSPEQAEMGGTDIDTRTDVYSLGVVLYELLTGLLPFEPGELRSKGYAEIQRIIREVDPPKAGTRLSAAAFKSAAAKSAAAHLAAEGKASGSDSHTREPSKPRGESAAIDYAIEQAETPAGAATEESSDISRTHKTDVEALVRELKRELEWIPLKAMEKDRTRRYSTPKELADDIRNYLAGRPLAAGPESVTYRLGKFARKNRGPLVAAGVVLVAVVGGLVGTSLGMVRAIRAESRVAASNSIFARLALALNPEEFNGSLREKQRRVAAIGNVVDSKTGMLLAEDEFAIRDCLARALISLEDYEGAEAQIRAALARAEEFPLDTKRLLDARLMLLVVVGACEEGKAIAAELASSVKGRESEFPVFTLALANERGMLTEVPAERLSIFREALDSPEGRGNASTLEAARLGMNAGLCLLQLGKLKEGQEQIATAERAAESLWPGGSPQHADTLATIARTYQAFGRYPEAATISRRALTMALAHLPPDSASVHQKRVVYLMQRNIIGDFATVRAEGLAALSLVSDPEDAEKAAPFVLAVGTALNELGDPLEAREYLERAVAHFEKGSDPARIGSARIDLASACLKLDDRAKAEASARQAMDVLSKSRTDQARMHEAASLLGEIRGLAGEADAEALLLESAAKVRNLTTIAPWRKKHMFRRAWEYLERRGRAEEGAAWRKSADNLSSS